MDTTKEYIKMCEESPLQELWTPVAWDYVYCRVDNKVEILSGYQTDCGIYGHGIDEGYTSRYYCPHKMYDGLDEFKEDHFCLFRQDQLQEMIPEPKGFIGNWPLVQTRKLLDWADHEHTGIYTWGESYEQLWLAFVMKEK